MTTQRKAQAITIAILVGALGVAAWRKGIIKAPNLPATVSAQKNETTPQDVIYAMFDAARDGKVSDYVNAHTGQMEQSLRKAISEQGDAAFAQYLRESNAPIKGVALQDPQQLTDREVKVRVEYVFQDRNEIQYMYLERIGNTWKIARVDAAERIKTLVPYGTPVR